MKNEKNTRKRRKRRRRIILENKIAIISLVISLLSLFISYRSIQLEEVEHRARFICVTKDNEEYKNSNLKIHIIKNIGAPISNVEIINVQEILCFHRVVTGEDMEILLWKEEEFEEYNYKYDLEKQENSIEGSHLEFAAFMMDVYFETSGLLYHLNRWDDGYGVTCKRILEIRYTDAKGVICSECYEIKENYICSLNYTPQLKDYYPNVIWGFWPIGGYDSEDAFQDGIEDAEKMITDRLGINIEDEMEKLDELYEEKHKRNK